MQLLKGQNELGSTMGCNSGASPVWVVDVEVPKKDMVGRGIRNSGRDKGKSLVGVKWERLIRGLVFSGTRGKISRSVNIVDYDISDTFNRAPEA